MMSDLSTFPIVLRIRTRSLTISLFSWTRRRFAFGSVCNMCLSYFSQMSFRFIALTSVSCSTLIRASFFLAPKVYDALFFGIGFVAVIASLILVVPSSRAFCLACSFWRRISSSVSIVSIESVLHLRRLLIVNWLVIVGSWYRFWFLVQLFLWGWGRSLTENQLLCFASPLRTWCGRWDVVHNHMHSIVWEGLPLFGRSELLTCYLSSQESVGLFLIRYGCILEIRDISLRTLCSRLTFLVVPGKTLSIRMRLGFWKFSFLNWVFCYCLLPSLVHSLRRENWHPSLGRIGVLIWLFESQSACSRWCCVDRFVFVEHFFRHFDLFVCLQEFVKSNQFFW